MDFEAVFKLILEQFSKHKIRFAVIGGFALHAAGFPRATQDIDFLLHHEDMPKVKTLLTALGYESLHESPNAANFLNRLSELGRIDFIIAHRKYTLAMLARAKPYEIIKNYKVAVAVPEDIIGLKVQALHNDPERKSQDLADIEWLIRNHYKKLDMNLLREYFTLFNYTGQLDQILKETGHA